MTPGPDLTYENYLAAGEFRIQRCERCARHAFYPRLLCPACGSPELSWVRATGAGTVYSATVMRRRAEAGGDYNVSLVDLEEGPRLMTRVEGVAPAQVRIGMAVTARIAGAGEDGHFIVFDAKDSAHGR
ncbi:MAG: OB-fold domain-containing protein [Burkholderiales bacterium]|nr:OB-fold domain-containing protein [Burkholderiales bacterium]